MWRERPRFVASVEHIARDLGDITHQNAIVCVWAVDPTFRVANRRSLLRRASTAVVLIFPEIAADASLAATSAATAAADRPTGRGGWITCSQAAATLAGSASAPSNCNSAERSCRNAHPAMRQLLASVANARSRHRVRICHDNERSAAPSPFQSHTA